MGNIFVPLSFVMKKASPLNDMNKALLILDDSVIASYKLYLRIPVSMPLLP
jgi:hypothetical protein